MQLKSMKQNYFSILFTKLFLLIFLFIPFQNTQAIENTEYIKEYTVEIKVNPERTLTVKENITYNMPDNTKRGIFRDINKQSPKSIDGDVFDIDITNINVSMNGKNNYPFKLTEDSKNYNIRIGDPDVYLNRGIYNYEIEYTVSGSGAIRYNPNLNSDIDEIYWNAIGNDWNIPIAKVSVKLIFPAKLDQNLLQISCYTGVFDSKEQNCTYTNNLNNEVSEINFTSNEIFGNQKGLSIAVGFPRGIIAENYINSVKEPKQNLFADIFLLLIQIFSITIMLVIWFKKGRDKIDKNRILVEYDAPLGLKPAEVARVNTNFYTIDEITSTIVDLAVKGFLKIKEIELNPIEQIAVQIKPFINLNTNNENNKKENRFLNMLSSKEYQLICQKPNFESDQSLSEYEKLILKTLFKESQEITILELKAKKSFLLIKNVLDKLVLEDKIKQENLFENNPENIKLKYMGLFVLINLGIFILGIIFYMLFSLEYSPIFFVIHIIILVISMILASLMPRRTPRGIEAWMHILGYKKYIVEAEQRRLEFQEKENIFFDVLPYAMALGVVDKWTKAFDDMLFDSPDWYESQNAFSMVSFSSGLSRLSSSITESSTSSSSGSSGGGSSGGGSGGGGGGSW